MARIRTIKPEFWVDDVLVELPFETRLLFIGLWNFVDDAGFIEYKPKRIKMQIFPADDVLIEDSLSALVESGRLHVYASDQGKLLRIVNWERHQKINRPTPTRFTGIIDQSTGDSVSAHAPVSEDSRGKGKERKGKERKGEVPSPSEVAIAPTRPEYGNLLDLLDSLIVANGSKKPGRTKKNVDAVRLLVERDGRTVQQVEAAIRWCQSDEFWRGNILSMSKLREQYDKLRLAAERGQAKQRSVTENQARGLSLVEQYREQEVGHAQIANG